MSGAAPGILFVATVPAPIRNFLLPYADYFRARGWRVHAAAAGATRETALLDHFSSVHELSLSRSSKDLRRNLRGGGEIRRLGRDLDVELVHVHTPIAGFVTRFALGRGPRRQRPAVIYTAHGFHAFDGGKRGSNLIYGLAETIAGRWTDALIVINRQDENRALRLKMVPPRKLHLMPGIGIDLDHYRPAAVSAREALAFRDAVGVPPDVPMFVMIAELHRPKRPLDAVAALAGSRRRSSHLVVLGDGPLAGEMRRSATEYGLEDRVHLPGFVDDVRPALASATAGLLTSAREGLPRAIMETLAMGVPVVCTDARGCAEVVGEAGMVVPVGDVDALSTALDAMDGTSVKWIRVSELARASVARFDISRLLALHEELYWELLGSGRGDRVPSSQSDSTA